MKYRIFLAQMVEMTAQVDIEAESEERARDLAYGLGPQLEWQQTENSDAVEIYEVWDEEEIEEMTKRGAL